MGKLSHETVTSALRLHCAGDLLQGLLALATLPLLEDMNLRRGFKLVTALAEMSVTLPASQIWTWGRGSGLGEVPQLRSGVEWRRPKHRESLSRT